MQQARTAGRMSGAGSTVGVPVSVSHSASAAVLSGRTTASSDHQASPGTGHLNRPTFTLDNNVPNDDTRSLVAFFFIYV